MASNQLSFNLFYDFIVDTIERRHIAITILLITKDVASALNVQVLAGTLLITYGLNGTYCARPSSECSDHSSRMNSHTSQRWQQNQLHLCHTDLCTLMTLYFILLILCHTRCLSTRIAYSIFPLFACLR